METRTSLKVCVLFVIALLFRAEPSFGQDRTVGLITRDAAQSYDGYTLLAPNLNGLVYLLDPEGFKVHEWSSGWLPGAVTYLMDNGNLLRTAGMPSEVFNAGGIGGRVQEIDWENNVIWDFVYWDSTKALHHDVEILPNGNVLMIAWEYKSREESVAAGRDTTLLDEDALWPDHLIEVRKTGLNSGDIVWEWHAWDHLIQDFDSTKSNFGVVEDHPELIDINAVGNGFADWLHINAVDYNAELDQIILSVPTLGATWIIDHSTTTEEAAGHAGGNSGKGGDLLYRWGNPRWYARGDASDTDLFFQHDTQWIEPGLPGEGNILIFNNGATRSEPRFSDVIEIVPPLNGDGSYELDPVAPYGPIAPVWQYVADPPEHFFARFISGANRLPNGNTLICDGPHGRIFEVTPAGETVWEYINPVTDEGILRQFDEVPEWFVPNSLTNIVFRAYRYPLDHPGLQGKDLSRKGTVELEPVGIEDVPSLAETFSLHPAYPNPVRTTATVPFTMSEPGEVVIALYNILGQRVRTGVSGQYFAPGEHRVLLDVRGLSSGTYVVRLIAERGSASHVIAVIS